MPLTQSERKIRASIAGHTSWANTQNRTARTEPGRRGLLKRFEREVDPDGTLDPAERAMRAENLKKAYFQRLAFRSAKARRAHRDGVPQRPKGGEAEGGSADARAEVA
jgi:hypothetical protein